MKGAALFGTIVFALVFLVAGISRIVASVHFTQDCGGHMGLAAKANSIELAKKEMNIVVEYAKRRGLIGGYTSILWRTPDEDVGFWYNNMTQALDCLEKLPAGASEMEKSNTLMKLRESLVRHGEQGEFLAAPDGISIYPHNTAYCLWLALSSVLGALCLFLSAVFW